MSVEAGSQIAESVIALYTNNRRRGVNGLREYDYTCPSPRYYPHQWLWDSSFHAITLANFDPQRAQKELSTLLSNQKENGFVPCVAIWEKRYFFESLFYASKITQPPVIPLAYELVYGKSKNLQFVKNNFLKLNHFMTWFEVNRDKNANGLIEIIHPWEDGDDGNPSFDNQMGFVGNKPSDAKYFWAMYRLLARHMIAGWDEEKIYKARAFRAETLLFNSIYARSLLAMKKLAELVGEDREAATFQAKYKDLIDALISLCWDEEEGIFYDLDNNSKQTGIKNISSLMPIILPDMPRKIIKSLVEKHLLNKNEFWSNYPVVSVSMDQAAYDPGCGYKLWRGPVWLNTNWFLIKGLSCHGYGEVAEEIAQKSQELVEKSGFCEFYNPVTGEGYGQKDFGWSGLVIDM